MPPESKHQAPGPDHDVAVDRNRALEFRGIEHLLGVEAPMPPFHFPPDEKEPEARRPDLGDERAESNTVSSHAEAKNEKAIQRDIAEIEKKLQEQRQLCAALADEPAEHHEICQGEGRRPNSNAEINCRLFLDRCRALDEGED